MKERPILFSAPMVRAILAGTKTQTRRVMKPQPGPDITQVCNAEDGLWLTYIKQKYGQEGEITCPYGQTGDRLWVRETWAFGVSTGNSWHAESGPVGDASKYARRYAADGEPGFYGRWRPSIHMPRWASRILLEITDVRVERLQDMEGEHPSESDAIAEGVNAIHHGDGDYYYSAFRGVPHPKNWADPADAFKELWDSINAGRGLGWDTNPWVWAITFRSLDATQ